MKQLEEKKYFVTKLLLSRNSNNPMSSSEIILYVKEKFNDCNFTGTHVREVINKLRIEYVPIIANNKGYWISYNREEIFNQIKSLNSRVEAIKATTLGLAEVIKNVKENEEEMHKLSEIIKNDELLWK